MKNIVLIAAIIVATTTTLFAKDNTCSHSGWSIKGIIGSLMVDLKFEWVDNNPKEKVSTVNNKSKLITKSSGIKPRHKRNKNKVRSLNTRSIVKKQKNNNKKLLAVNNKKASIKDAKYVPVYNYCINDSCVDSCIGEKLYFSSVNDTTSIDTQKISKAKVLSAKNVGAEVVNSNSGVIASGDNMIINYNTPVLAGTIASSNSVNNFYDTGSKIVKTKKFKYFENHHRKSNSLQEFKFTDVTNEFADAQIGLQTLFQQDKILPNVNSYLCEAGQGLAQVYFLLEHKELLSKDKINVVNTTWGAITIIFKNKDIVIDRYYKEFVFYNEGGGVRLFYPQKNSFVDL
jgi:hypothetical protein